MSKFQDYLKNTGLTFEDYERWFRNLKIGDSVHRNLYYPDDLTKIEKVAESPTGNGIKFETLCSSGASLFYRLNSITKTMSLEYSEDKTKIINNPDSFPILSEAELIKFRNSSKSAISEDKIHDTSSFKLSEEKQEEKAMSNQTALKQEEISNKEYQVIELKDMSPGDLIEDPFGNLFVYGDGVLFDQNGKWHSFDNRYKYRLVQKRKHIRPLDGMFIYKNEKNNEELKSSYTHPRMWFSTCAKLGKEPEIVERRLMIPSFSNPIAILANLTDAYQLIDSQREPKLHALVLGNDGRYWVTKEFIRTEIKLPINNSSDEVEEWLEAKVEDLKTDLAARDQEIELLKKHVDQLNTKHESEIQGARQSLKATKEQYEANLKACKESFETLQKTASVIQNGRDDLLRQRDENTQKIALLNRQIERIVSEKSKLNEDIISLLGTQEMLRGELHKRVDHIEFLMKELTKEQEESKKARQKLQELSVALESFSNNEIE